jgi:hypothetical protein
MDHQTACGSAGRRARFGILRIAAASAVALAAIGCASQVPETIYIYPSDAVTPVPSPTAPAEATTATFATADPTTAPATAAPTTAPTAAATVAPTPFHPPTAVAARPNLYFSHYDTPNVYCGVAYVMHVTVRNSGPVAAVATNAFLFEQYPENHTLANVGAAVPALGAGGSANLQFSFTVSSACGLVHTMRLRVDGASVVSESDEDDNFVNLTHTVRASNLYPTDLTVPHDPSCASVPVGVRVNNNGTAATPTDFIVRFVDTYASVPAYSRAISVSTGVLAAGTSRVVSVTFTTIDDYVPSVCNHTHTMTVYVDATAVVPETIETGNSSSTTYHP